MHEELMEAVVSPENATAAWKAVVRNGGAPGIDGMTTEKLGDRVRKHWETIRSKLLAGTYVPSPVRRVEIPKPNFFDRVNHDILMTRIGRSIRDKAVLRLIGRYLRAGVMVEGLVQVSEEGTPQGGPLSPLLANIYLDALDQELDRRGLAFSRYADDCNIYVSNWCAYLRGWWAYYGHAEERRNLYRLEGWIRRHIRSCFWQRWHDWRGRLRKLRRLGLSGRPLKVAHSSHGAWRLARTPGLQAALSNKVLKRHGFLMPADLATTM